MKLEADLKNRLALILEKITASNAPLISKAFNGRLWIDETKGLEADVLGVKYKVSLANGHLSISIEDPLNREEDSSRLLGYLANAIERALSGKIARACGRLVGLTQLPGGHTARLYEKKTIDFLTIEMDGSKAQDVEKAVKAIGGYMVDHLNATWSFEVNPLNGVRIRVAFWQGEEDMPSGASVLIGEELKDVEVPIEELITILEMTINRFVLFYRRETGQKPKLYHSLYF